MARPRTFMRRTFTTLTLLTVVALLFGWLPSSAWLRGWIGSTLTTAAAGVGVDLTYAEIGGYAWRGLVLERPRIRGDGIDLVADRIRVEWFLPALVVGELPLRVDVARLGGEVELAQMRWEAATDGAAPVRVRLDALRVDAADVRIAEVPFTLPDLSVERFEATSLEDGRWQLLTTIATSEGRATGEVVGRFGETGLAITVHEGDARIGRHWWDGIDAGTIRGAMTWGPAGADGRFDLHDGALTYLDVPVTEVAGPITWRGDVIEASWVGSALDGRAQVAGSVDVGASWWRVEGEVVAGLPAAGRALVEVLGVPGFPVPEGGSVRGRVVAEGWAEVSLEADLRAEGTYLGADLVVPDLRVGFDAVRGVGVAVDGRWGEGELRVRTERRDGRTVWSGVAGPVRVVGVPVVGVEASWVVGGGPVSGRAVVRAGEGVWSADADVVLDAEGVQAFFTGSLAGEPFEGAVALAEPSLVAPLEGGVTWWPPDAALGGVPRVEARLAGTLAAPRARVSLMGAGPVAPRAVVGGGAPAGSGPVAEVVDLLGVVGGVGGGLFPGLDLRGDVDAAWVWDGGGWSVAGRLGPVALRGDEEGWAFELAALEPSGFLRGRIGPGEGAWRDGVWSATLVTELASAAGMPDGTPWWATSAMSWSVGGDAGGWSLRDATDTWRAAVTADGLSLTASGAVVALAGERALVDATWADGAGSATIAYPGIDAEATWHDGRATGVLRAGGETLPWSFDGDEVALAGRIDLAAALGVLDGVLGTAWATEADLAGTATLDARWRPGLALPEGHAALAVTSPLAFDIALDADGSRIGWRGRAEAPLWPVTTTGSWTPGAERPLEGEAAWGEAGTVRLDAAGLSGAGTWSGWQALAVAVEPQPWRLEVDPDGHARAAFGDSRLTFDPATLRIDAEVDLGARWGNEEARLQGRAAWSADARGGAPEGDLALVLSVAGDVLADVDGGLGGIVAALRGPTARWAAAVTPQLGPAGDGALAGEITGSLEWRPGADPTGAMRWTDRVGAPVALDLDADAIQAAGAGWTARVADGAVTVTADGARVDALLRRDEAAVEVRGQLHLPLSAAWLQDGVGALDVQVAVAGAEATGRIVLDDGARVEAEGTTAGVRIRASGPITTDPGPAWRGAWAWDGLEEIVTAGSGSFVLDADGLVADGDLVVAAASAGPLAWPELRLSVTLDEAGAVAAVGGGGLRGSWPAGLDADLTLAEEPITVSLQPDPAGMRVEIVGAGFEAVALGDLADWTIVGGGRAAGLGAVATASGSGTIAQGRWWVGGPDLARLAGSARDVAIAADGEAWANGTMGFDGAVLDLAVRGEDLDGSRWLPGVAVDPIRGDLRASVSVDGWRVDGDLAATVAADGVAADLRLIVRERLVELHVSGDVGGLPLHGAATGGDLAAVATTAWDVRLQVADVATTGRIDLGAGQVRVALTSADGAWHLDAVGGERGTAALRGPQQIDLAATWSLAPDVEVALHGAVAGIEVTGGLAAPAGDLRAATVALDAVDPSGRWRARLGGPLAPLDLHGEGGFAGAPFPLALTAEPTWRLRWGALDAVPRRGGIELSGSTADGQLPFVVLEADGLGWSPADGWWGRGRLSATAAADLTAVAELDGGGPLRAAVRVTQAGVDIGGASLSLPADPTLGVTGEVDLMVRLEAPAAVPWTVRARGPVTADATAWGATLSVDVQGPLALQGTALVGPDGSTVVLEGPGLRIDGDWTDGVGAARLRLQGLSVADLQPWLPEGSVSGEARVAIDAGGVAWWVEQVELVTPAGRVSGDAAGGPDGLARAAIDVDVDLARLAPMLFDAPPLDAFRGRVRGPVTLAGDVTSPEAWAIGADLTAAGVAWSALDAEVDGSVVVSGSVGDPILAATWAARGEAARLDGTARWRPTLGETALRAQGTVFDASLHLDLLLTSGGFAGGGSVGWAGTAWSIAGQDGQLVGSGLGAWDGWRATLDPRTRRVSLEGDLEVVPLATGTVAGTIDVASGRPVADIVWRDLAVAGVALGDGTLQGDLDEGLRLVGERLVATVQPDLASASLAVRELPMPLGDTTLTLDARIDASGVAMGARWAGPTPAGEVDLRLDLDDANGAWRGTVSGLFLDGRVTLPVAWVDGELTGSGLLEGASLAGVPLAATIDLGGELAAPTLEVAAVAGADGAWRADLAWAHGAALVGVVVPLPAGSSLTARGRAWPDVDVVIDGGAAGRVRATADWRGRPLSLDGDLDADIGPVRLEMAGPATLRLSVPEFGGGLRATLPARPIPGAIEEIRRDGWRWIGEGSVDGALVVAREGAPWVEIEALSIGWRELRATMAGSIDATEADVEVTLDLSPLASAFSGAGAWPWHVPVRARVAWDGTRIDVVSEAPWSSRWRLDAGGRTLEVDLDLRGVTETAAPLARGRLQLDDGGWAGALDVRTVTHAFGATPSTIEARLGGGGEHLTLAATLRDGGGSVSVTGRWDGAELRPPGWGIDTPRLREFDARVVGLEVANFAGTDAAAGTVTGSVTLRGAAVFGRLTSDALRLGGRTAPAQLEFQADLDEPTGLRASGRLDLGGADAQVDVDLHGVEAYIRLERFPLHELVSAALGPSDVVAEVTGAVRGAWAWGAAAPSDLRVASERIRLERAGVETRGQLSFTWDGVSLTIGEAAFEGRGEWQLRGSATPDLLDLELLARDADFGPLLGLVPAFARYDVTADGDLVISARGTPSAPDVLMRTDDLELGVAGTRYRLEDVRVTLRGEAWTGRAEIAGVAPLGGRVTLFSEGRVGPWPDTSFSLAARAVGELEVPFVGRVDDLVVDVAWSDAAAANLRAEGRMGSPFTVTGSLSPLDLRGTGSDLRLAIPFLYVAESTVDADLRLIGESDGVRLAGRVDATQARVDTAARRAAAVDPEAVDGGAAAAAAEGPAAPSDARTRFRFDGIRIVAPQRVTFAESFGNAEAAVDLTLDGTAAAPRLSGSVRALRGTVRFAGRDLELTEALATFDPTRGVYPSLRLAGRTAVDKARVVPPGDPVRFLSPQGPRFTIELVLEGDATAAETGFALDLQPRFSSDAIVDGIDGGGPRPLTDLELLTVLTLGRLEGSVGVAGAVAQSALDTAVELLVTAEVQAILAEALGVEVVELRTTAVSTLIDGSDPFGVSLRLGGYVSDEVFASYRVSTLGGATFSNEVAFAYQLGPVGIDITGRFDVASGAAAASPSLAVGARYGFAPGLALEFGVDLSTERSTARLGVTWRW
jgi:hypothetical protein